MSCSWRTVSCTTPQHGKKAWIMRLREQVVGFSVPPCRHMVTPLNMWCSRLIVSCTTPQHGNKAWTMRLRVQVIGFNVPHCRHMVTRRNMCCSRLTVSWTHGYKLKHVMCKVKSDMQYSTTWEESVDHEVKGTSCSVYCSCLHTHGYKLKHVLFKVNSVMDTWL